MSEKTPPPAGPEDESLVQLRDDLAWQMRRVGAKRHGPFDALAAVVAAVALVAGPQSAVMPPKPAPREERREEDDGDDAPRPVPPAALDDDLEIPAFLRRQRQP